MLKSRRFIHGSGIPVPISPSISNLLEKKKGAAAAAFLLVLLSVALSFSISNNATASSTLPKSADSVVKASEPIVSGGQLGQSVSSSPSSIGIGNHTTNNTAQNVQTTTSIKAQPNRVAVGNAISVCVTVSPPPPTADDVFGNLTLLILRPDGTVNLLSSFVADSAGVFAVNYVAEMIGGYRLRAVYGGQFFASCNVTYLGSESPEISLTIFSDAHVKTWTVDDNGPADFHTIQAAINAAEDGDVVEVSGGYYCEHVVLNRTLTLVSLENAIIDANADSSIVVKPTIARWNGVTIIADYCTLSGFTVRFGANSDIEIKGDGCTVKNNTCLNARCRGGISLYGDPEGYSDTSATTPRNNLIIGNTIRECATGLFAKNAHDNIVTENVFDLSQFAGIYLLSYSSNNTFTDNIVSRSTHTWSGEGGYGIVLGTGSEGNLFTGNTIRNNSAAGFAIDIFGLGYPSPNSNRISHNNFYGNCVQAYDKGDSNVWDDGYPSGGNYWSDYIGVDANRDGLGDVVYAISSNNSDRYPLMTFHSTST